MEWVVGLTSWALLKLCRCQAYDAKEKEARAEEGCGNSEFNNMSLQTKQPVFTQCSPQQQTVGLWSQCLETKEDVKESVFYHCRVATPWEGSSFSLKDTIRQGMNYDFLTSLTQTERDFTGGIQFLNINQKVEIT